MSQEKEVNMTAETPPEESWWNSILTTDKTQIPPSERPLAPSKETPGQEPDWTRAEEIYQQDEIITLKVVGFNRGDSW